MAVKEDTAIVWTAMADGRNHVRDQVPVGGASVKIQETANPTHGVDPYLFRKRLKDCNRAIGERSQHSIFLRGQEYSELGKFIPCPAGLALWLHTQTHSSDEFFVGVLSGERNRGFSEDFR